jgi:hypothetical protein
MELPLVLTGVLTAALCGLMTWAAARRYGRRRALVVPLLAMVAITLMLWRMSGVQAAQAMEVAAIGAAIAGPSIAGALVGLFLSRRGG